MEEKIIIPAIIIIYNTISFLYFELSVHPTPPQNDSVLVEGGVCIPPEGATTGVPV
jgi:hypothetical protein